MQLLEVVTFILYDQLYTDNLYTVNYPEFANFFVEIGVCFWYTVFIPIR
jgi:hypothetical protein